MINAVALALMLLQQELEAAKVGGAAPAIVAGLANAIAELQKVHGSDVTFAQLESLRTKPTW